MIPWYLFTLFTRSPNWAKARSVTFDFAELPGNQQRLANLTEWLEPRGRDEMQRWIQEQVSDSRELMIALICFFVEGGATYWIYLNNTECDWISIRYWWEVMSKLQWRDFFGTTRLESKLTKTSTEAVVCRIWPISTPINPCAGELECQRARQPKCHGRCWTFESGWIYCCGRLVYNIMWPFRCSWWPWVKRVWRRQWSSFAVSSRGCDPQSQVYAWLANTSAA